MPDLYKSKVWLTRRYVTQKKTVTEISKECNASVQTIQNWLEKFELIRNQRRWGKR